MMMKRWLRTEALLLALCLLACAFFLPGAAAMETGDEIFRTADGGTVSLSELLEDRKMVLITVFATWCGQCRVDFPVLQTVYEAWKDEAAVVAVSGDRTDTGETLREYAVSMGLTFPFVAGGDSSLPDELRVTAYPTTFVIDRFGQVALRLVGALPDSAALARLFSSFCSEDYTGSVFPEGLPSAAAQAAGGTDGRLTDCLTQTAGVSFSSGGRSWEWPFVPDEAGYAVSTNGGEAGSSSVLYARVNAAEDRVLSWQFSVSSEPLYDALTVQLDGETVRVYSGETGTRTDALFLTAGAHEIIFSYQKDGFGDEGDDRAAVGSFSLLGGQDAQTALAALPVHPWAETASLAAVNEGTREFSVSDPQGMLARVYGPVRVFVTAGETAALKMTLGKETDPWAACVLFSDGREPVPALSCEAEDGYLLKAPVNPEESFMQASVCEIYPNAQRTLCSALIFPDSETMEAFFAYLNGAYGADITWREELPSADAEENP